MITINLLVNEFTIGWANIGRIIEDPFEKEKTKDQLLDEFFEG